MKNICKKHITFFNHHQPFKVKRLMMFILLIGTVLFTEFNSNAQLKLPSIPSNTQLSNNFEFDADYIYRVDLSGAYLEDGALIAYVDGKIRGAQTASVLFTPTNTVVYKIRLFSNTNANKITPA